MKPLLIATAATALTAGSAMALTDIDAVDFDNSGFVSIEEMKAVFPEMPVQSFRDIDTNGDNRVSPQELQTIQAQTEIDRFEMAPVETRRVVILDADSSGYIDASEMTAVFDEFDAEDFDRIDVNDDNRVTYQEYYAPEAAQIIARYGTGTVKDIAEIDTNGDAFADFDELVASFPGLSQTDFDEIDENDDNRVSAQELYELDAQAIVSRAAS